MRAANRVGLLVAAWLLGCAPRAMDAHGELIELPKGASADQVLAQMGRRPDQVRRIGTHVEDWVYIEPELARTFVLRMQDGELRWVKEIEPVGHRY